MDTTVITEEASDRTLSYVSAFIEQNRSSTLTSTDELDISKIPEFECKFVGKVRDVIICKDIVIMICTDRQSAFDRSLASIPFKGQVLNLLSNWWFTHSLNLVPTTFLACPHANVTIAKRCKVFPVEFVVRGYITGITATSMWHHYSNGIRYYCGHNLPEGLVRNQRLARHLLTPTTKSAEHDALTSAEEIVASGTMTVEQYHQCAHYALTMFAFGQTECERRGLILVDTKYEFGMDREGVIRLVDEVHTPDSSRFWVAHSYQQRFDEGQEPESVDKEVLRRWYVAHCDPYDTNVPLPEAPPELVAELARRYIMVYEILTGEKWPERTLPSTSLPTTSETEVDTGASTANTTAVTTIATVTPIANTTRTNTATTDIMDASGATNTTINTTAQSVTEALYAYFHTQE